MITVGIDVGTRFVKTCVVRDGILVGSAIDEIKKNIYRVIRESYRRARRQAGIHRFRVDRLASTGFGAELVRRSIATRQEICMVRAVQAFDPSARTVIDIGSLFIRIARVGEAGRVLDSCVNEKCAAGSGRFLEMIAEAMGIPVTQVSDVAARAGDPFKFTNGCAVFAESEIISELNKGRSGADILSGMIRSIASKIQTMLERLQALGPFALIGGVASISYLTLALGEITGARILSLPLSPQLMLAYGAALVASE
jgi:(R)-2-hydroxyacyl-CoA dehydratese activating ATPase